MIAYVTCIVTLVFYLFLFFVIKQVHTHPMVTTVSNTTDSPNRAPRAIVVVVMEFLLTPGCLFLLVSVCTKGAVLDGCKQVDGVAETVVVVVTIVLDWLGESIVVVVVYCGSAVIVAFGQKSLRSNEYTESVQFSSSGY